MKHPRSLYLYIKLDLSINNLKKLQVDFGNQASVSKVIVAVDASALGNGWTRKA
jgi:hypothetical protein